MLLGSTITPYLERRKRAGGPTGRMSDELDSARGALGWSLVVATATPDRESGEKLAGAAVAARLAGTAQVVGPVTSFFWHLGESGRGEEFNVTFKTTDARYAELEAYIIANHPWDKPEVTAVELVRGSADYLAWAEESTRRS
ncbi:divalent-cation tolerance protein CutA [Amycolatopsis sp. CB00013]|uniref:divalent-cation tolerance protein CutA n=1 Tax=Amycolatopsis sp. CB00013 TaxID=1703945 RepID=UPI001F51C9CD|nr:divalent cation tolerance protein CutA [Amycolatopsis sp. CB00013]